MFKKVLLSEDIDTISQGIKSVMNALHIENVHQVQYCDDAYLKIKKSYLDELPFDLLITDLSFVPDHREQKLTSGDALIKTLREEFPTLKIIVYSVENRTERIRTLFNELKIDAYITKGRVGLRELRDAIITVNNGGTYLSPELDKILTSKPPLEIVEYDIQLLKMLSLGHSQDQISLLFKKKNIKPNSLSSLEKRLNALRNHFSSKNVVHLISIVKDLGLI